MVPPNNDDHWLVRPRTIRLLWIAFVAVLVATVAVNLIVEPHGEFGIDGSVGFNAWYGFLSCVAMIFGALALGIGLKRRDDYYDS